MAEAEQVIAAVARVSYARLVSFLAARSGDVASAEDALSEAFVAAVRTWPEQGIPSKPEAWLLQAARRRLTDQLRAQQTRHRHAAALQETWVDAEGSTADLSFPDERLKLLFVCAHPAIDARVHTPLMLQVVLGLDAVAIGSAFLVPAATMGQRLTRAKIKIRDTRISFEIPTGEQLPARLFAVLEAIYAAYARGWDDVDGAEGERRGLTEESLDLARMLVELLPQEPEALGLLSLMLYCEARRPARRDPRGEYVPISAQDTQLWSMPLLHEAEQLLRAAAVLARPGRFQLEAAVQSAHVERARTGRTNWDGVALLYEGLVRVAPTIGAQLGRAAAIADARGAQLGLELLSAIPKEVVEAHQPYWALCAHLRARLGQVDAAHAAFETAISLSHDPAVRRFLERRQRELSGARSY